MSEETADLLAGTREYIEKNGWWRGSLFGPNGRQVCLVGGMLRTLGLRKHEVVDPRVQHAKSVLLPVVNRDREQRHRVCDVEMWNDHYAKNKQDVLDVLAKAEKIERAGFDPDAA